jgi:polysaccharide export outer membrane protein
MTYREATIGFPRAAAVVAAVLVGSACAASAQTAPPPVPAPAAAAQANGEGVPLPEGYVIGAQDVLGVIFWREQDMSTDVAVRPDGMITLPLINEVRAAGLTPDQLRATLTDRAAKFIQEPNVSIVVKAINSRKVSVAGNVGKPGEYPLLSRMTVLQLIAQAGGLQEFAKEKDILVVRTENGKQVSYKFNYKDVSRGKNLQQNIELKPGDVVIVP